MRDRILLLVYFAAAVGVTLVHSVVVLASVTAVVYLLAWKDGPAIAKRALHAVAFFNLVVTIAYVTVGLIQGTLSAYFVVLLNLRVLCLTSMAFLAVRRVNLFRAALFFAPLARLLILAYGQIITLRKLLSDSREAFRSRSIRHASLRSLYRHAAVNGTFLFDRAIHRSNEITDAMRSRGFFHDAT